MADVSVVVIVYNDQDRLAAAVRSALEQTLGGVEVVIVDDHSADRSFEVARELEAQNPGRVRAFQLPENSGGCGRPRNHGAARAVGRYVMFLDSDDTLDRNACRNMLAAAEASGADLVSGLCTRVYVDSRRKRQQPWYRWLYQESRVLESITDLPELLVWDTLATNKAYRREFLLEHGLRFASGVCYEDLLFSAQAYLAARRIALIPNRVYYWNVQQRATEKSITQRRGEIRNLADRLDMHRRVDGLLAARGLRGIRHAKDVKFLKHDLVLHLRDLPRRGGEYRREFAELARGYLDTFPPDAYRDLDPIQAVCAYLFSRGDLANLLPAVDALLNSRKLAVPLVERDGRVYWCGEHLDDPLGRELLDVTDMGYHVRPLAGLNPRNVLTGYSYRGGRVRLAGRVINPLARIPATARIRGRLELKARRANPLTFRFPLRELVHRGDFLAWSAELDVTSRFHPFGVVDDVWDIRLLLEIDGVRVSTRITAEEAVVDLAPVPVRPRLTRAVANEVEPEISARGHLAFHVVASGPLQRRVRAGLAAAAGSGPGRKGRALVSGALRTPRTLKSVRTRLWVYHTVFSRLPCRKGLVVFESHLGGQYSDSPRAVYEEARRQKAPITAVWSYARDTRGFPEDAVLVRRWSLSYLRALAQAEYWVDNQGFPTALDKPGHTTYIQTWHGSALKRMGFDEAAVKLGSREERAALQRALDRFDAFCVRSQHDMDTLVKAFRLAPSVPIPTGYPRNDDLVRVRKAEERAGPRVRGPLADRLGIAEEKTVLLYAPTFRGRPGGRRARLQLPFDAESFTRAFADRYVLLVRAHYLDQLVLPPSVADTVIDVSAEHDATPLLALADGLITDYSSVMFDYALLDRPMIFFTHDYDDYVRRSRGTYFELADEAPGPLVRTQEELFAVAGELKAVDADYAAARRAFAAKFGAFDTGDAAQSIVRRFLAPGRRA